MSDIKERLDDAVHELVENGVGAGLIDVALEAGERVVRLEAENAALRVDAERYQWLRQIAPCLAWEGLLQTRLDSAEDIDAAVDALTQSKADE